MQDPQLLALVVYICFLCNVNKLGRTARARAIENNKLREKEITRREGDDEVGSDSQPHLQIFAGIPELQRSSWLLKESSLYLFTDLGPELSVQTLLFYRIFV